MSEPLTAEELAELRNTAVYGMSYGKTAISRLFATIATLTARAEQAEAERDAQSREIAAKVTRIAALESRHVYYVSDRYPGRCYYCLRAKKDHHPDTRAAEAEARVAELTAAILDIDAHAAPFGEDAEGYVTGGYIISVGCLHRALGLVGHASRKCSPQNLCAACAPPMPKLDAKAVIGMNTVGGPRNEGRAAMEGQR